MYNTQRFITAARCAAALSLVGCVTAGGPSSPPIEPQPAGRIHYAPTEQAAHGPVLPNALFVWYDNGPVIYDPKIYLIFWGYKRYGDPDKAQPLLASYMKNMGGSSHNNIYTQYYEVSGKSTIYITNPKGQLGGVWNDDSEVPKTPTDSQVAAEALKAVAHVGYNPNGLYVVATPHGRSSAGFGTNWCAYHSYTYYEKTKLLAYDNFPYMPDTSGCGKNIIAPPTDESGNDEGVTILAGHEVGEAITDPQPYTGWKGTDGEIGDYCAWHNMKNDKFGSKSYTTQPMLSNTTHSCVQDYK